MDLRFNSILVRLKGRDNTLLYVILGCFNSILVRLKDRTGTFTSTGTLSFNSILVRLKGSMPETLPAWSRVSIPFWYD